MTEITKLEFEGKGIVTIRHRDGREIWLAQQVSDALGYARSDALGNRIREEWGNEFERGLHYDVIEGEELRQLREALTPYYGVSPNAAALLVLYEPGVHLVCQKTDKPAGVKLRRWLAVEVLPALRRSGAYAPHTGHAAHGLHLAVRDREARLQQAGHARRVLELLKITNNLSPQNELTYEIEIAELATGLNLLALRPAIDHVGWKTPSEIAEELGVSAQRVGRVITGLGLRNHVPGKVEQYQTKSDTSSRVVDCWRYGPEAVAQIKAQFAGPKTKVSA